MQTEKKTFIVKDYNRELGKVLSNSKDWEGNRQLRKKVLLDIEIPVINPQDLLEQPRELT